MVEVLTTFKTSDQTFFLAISIMDRFFKMTDRKIHSSELHLTGIASMFIASKYEDVHCLTMKTVINKIGHDKFDVMQIQVRELEILKTIGFTIGVPTVKEFIDKYLFELREYLPKSETL